MPESRHLIVYSRFPEAGKTKTRLIPTLGAQGAADLQCAMSGHTLLTSRVAAARIDARLCVHFAGGSAQAMRRWLGDGTPYEAQGEGDLGQRMERTFQDSFARGSSATVIIGTDCPSLTPDILVAAFEGLQEHDIVIGPAADGGYYLIGLRKPLPEIFSGIDWGTETVLRQTLATLEGTEPDIHWLPPLNDIDTADDLAAWDEVKPPAAKKPEIISVVMPALNEADNIADVIEAAQAHAAEIIVVDGGSSDSTCEQAEALGATVIRTAPGRACQMNAGALRATGEVLLFLHADTVLPADAAIQIRQAMARKGTVCGAFRLGITGNGPGLRCIEALANLRSRVFGMPFGDQAIFVRSDAFREIGGYGDLPIMEDFDLVRRLKKVGRRTLLPSSVLASGRRWHRLGVLKTTLINQRVIAGYCLGQSPEALVRQYRRHRGLEKT